MVAEQITIGEGIVGTLLNMRNTIPDAQKNLEAYARKTRTVAAPMPVLLQGIPYRKWITANSEDYSGINIDRKFGAKGECVIATRHGGSDGKWGLLTPDILQTASDMYKKGRGGLNDVYAAVLGDLYKRNVLRDMLNGGMPDGRAIAVFSYEQLVAGECPRDGSEYVVVRPLSLARKTDSGHNLIARSVGPKGKVIDSQIITYAGGVQDAQYVVDNAKRKSFLGNLGIRRDFNNLNSFNLAEPQGRVLFVGNFDLSLYDYDSLSLACFLAVAPETLVGAERRQQLEDMLTLRLPRATLEAMRAGNDFTYEGKQYILKPLQ